jgi:hypothetical protein
MYSRNASRDRGANYRQAPGELAKLEKFINTEIRPFVAQLRAIEQTARQLLPQPMQGYLKEIDLIINTTPHTIRSAITAWDALEPPIWQMDGKSIDTNARAQLIAQIRSGLRNWDGQRGRLSRAWGRRRHSGEALADDTGSIGIGSTLPTPICDAATSVWDHQRTRRWCRRTRRLIHP